MREDYNLESNKEYTMNGLGPVNSLLSPNVNTMI